MKYKLTIFLALELALIGTLLVIAHPFPQPSCCTLAGNFHPPEPPISRLEGLKP